jgi:hypothetical protein
VPYLLLAQARSRRAGLSIWEMGVGKLLSGAVTTSFLALPAGMRSIDCKCARSARAHALPGALA